MTERAEHLAMVRGKKTVSSGAWKAIGNEELSAMVHRTKRSTTMLGMTIGSSLASGVLYDSACADGTDGWSLRLYPLWLEMYSCPCPATSDMNVLGQVGEMPCPPILVRRQRAGNSFVTNDWLAEVDT